MKWLPQSMRKYSMRWLTLLNAAIRALNNGPVASTRLQTVAELDATAIYAKWNAAKKAEH
jgi:hypothetical protein